MDLLRRLRTRHLEELWRVMRNGGLRRRLERRYGMCLRREREFAEISRRKGWKRAEYARERPVEGSWGGAVRLLWLRDMVEKELDGRMGWGNVRRESVRPRLFTEQIARLMRRCDKDMRWEQIKVRRLKHGEELQSKSFL